MLILFFSFLKCEKFEYSPYQKENKKSPVKLNEVNIDKILSHEDTEDDTVTILFTGDSQRFYDELSDLVERANKISDIDFLILAGDISDFSLNQEFIWINDRLKKLYFPYLCVIGNHDLLANGPEIYESIFGEKNFSFVYKGYKFIFHDNNGLEYGYNGKIPDLDWLSGQLNDSIPDWFIAISHIPPYGSDFDKTLEIPYRDLFASDRRFILSLHGHQHSTTDNFYYNNHVRYIVSNSVQKKSFLLLKLVNGNIIKEIVNFSE